jgi:hypothetical protein
MNLITTLVLIVFSYYILYIVSLLFPKGRQQIIKKNDKLEQMRHIPLKTLKQQKEFIDTKYPKSYKTDWVGIIINIAAFIIVFMVLNYLVGKIWRFQFSAIGGILAILVIVIGLNSLLKLFNLQQNDIGVMFK